MGPFETKPVFATAVRIIDVGRQVAQIATDRHLGLIAAGVAFFGMFGIFPGLAAVIAVFGLVADPQIISDQLLLMQGIIPEDAYRLLSIQINRLLLTPTGTLGWATGVSIALALWSSRAGVSALISGLNAITGQRPRGSLRQVAVALVLTLALVGLALVALAVVVVMPVILAFLSLTNATVWMIEAARWVAALGVLLLGLGLLYRFGPVGQTRRTQWISLGAIVVVIVWLAASAGLSFYLGNFASYNEIYGSLGAIIGLLLWLYVSAYLILLGAALNAVVYRQSGAE